MRKKSFTRDIIVYTVIITVLLFSVLVFYTASTVVAVRDELMRSSENFLQLYGNELKGRIDQADRTLKNVLTQNSRDISLLKSGDETTRYHASQSIFNFIDELSKNETSVDMLVVADKEYDICLDAQAVPMNLGQRTELRDFTKASTIDSSISARWYFENVGNTRYLIKIYAYNGRSVAAFINADSFLASIPVGDYEKQIMLLSDASGSTSALQTDQDVELVLDKPADQYGEATWLRLAYPIVPNEIVLHSVIELNLFNQLRFSMIAAVAMIFMPLLLSIFLLRSVKREITSPMHVMTDEMKRINDGEYEVRMDGEFSSVEFTMLQRTFNKLMDEIIGLKLKSYEKMIELQDAELKYIRLQLRPHFFLNAMSTISSLSSQGKNAQIKQYIDALSRNIRYMFKSGLHTVPIREELRHVENYLEMQELKYPDCVFHFIEIAPDLEYWPIPQMLIHTYVENEFKYAVSIEKSLTLLIKAARTEYKGEEMLMIEIEDDGQGYPEDVLQTLNQPDAKPTATGHRIGLWSVRRMMELMYERSDLLSFENIEPHGCLNRIYVPAKPLHELEEETIQNSIE